MYRFNIVRMVSKWKRDPFKYNKCIGSIARGLVKDVKYSVFKYNKCIGSMRYKKTKFRDNIHLNTTNVSVQYILPL